MRGHDQLITVSLRPRGTAVIHSVGRAQGIEGGRCRAIIDDRLGLRRCGRRGWFSLRSPEAQVVQPLCSTHLHRLIEQGGAVHLDEANAIAHDE